VQWNFAGVRRKMFEQSEFFLRSKMERNGGNLPSPQAMAGKEFGCVFLLRFLSHSKK